MTLRQAVAEAAAHLSANPHFDAEVRRDAELLLLHTLRITRAQFLANPARILTADKQSLYRQAIARRLTNEPVQYITGHQEFFGLDLTVTPATLIPRPETEHLVEAVLERLPHSQPLTILDIGTGTGAIAIALAAHLPQAQLVATDISGEALQVAESNARAHGLGGRIRFLHSNLLSGLPLPEQSNFFDAIVSNPPYVAESDRDTLHPQVRDFEPPQALYSGAHGLDIYRRLIPQASAALKAGGLLALEIGHGQRDDLAHLLSAWNDVHFVNDLQQIPRVALARK